jgi:hypothetical protein
MATRIIGTNSVFIHVPKTGGVWVEKAMKAAGIKTSRFGHEHGVYDRMIEEEMTFNGWIPSRIARRIHRGMRRMGFEKQPPRRFCFVRNPLTWYESFWRYKIDLNWQHWGREKRPAYWHPNSALNGLDSDDFNEFMWKVMSKRPGYASELLMRFANPEVDFVGRTENLADDLVTILRKLEIPFDEAELRATTRTNESQAPNSRVVWDPDLRKLATQLELPALVHFGYVNISDLGGISTPDIRHRGLV